MGRPKPSPVQCEGSKNPPSVSVEWWFGDSSTESIFRTVRPGVEADIQASDPYFNNFQCLTKEDAKEIYEAYVLGCKLWR